VAVYPDDTTDEVLLRGWLISAYMSRSARFSFASKSPKTDF
jgi:hypothetical protein